MTTLTSLVGLCLLFTMLWTAEGFPNGAPFIVCGVMRPMHNGRPQDIATFPADIYVTPNPAPPGTVVDVTVEWKLPNSTFRGLLVTARDMDNYKDFLPGFSLTDTSQYKLVDCDQQKSKRNDSGITHKERLNTKRTSFKWKIPSNATTFSKFVIRVTLVQSFTRYWAGKNVSITVVDRLRPPSPILRPSPPILPIPITQNQPFNLHDRPQMTSNTGSGSVLLPGTQQPGNVIGGNSDSGPLSLSVPQTSLGNSNPGMTDHADPLSLDEQSFGDSNSGMPEGEEQFGSQTNFVEFVEPPTLPTTTQDRIMQTGDSFRRTSSRNSAARGAPRKARTHPPWVQAWLG